MTPTAASALPSSARFPSRAADPWSAFLSIGLATQSPAVVAAAGGFTICVRGRGEFLTELRPAVALFLRFGGIDYDGDPAGALKLDAYIRVGASASSQQYDSYLLQLTIGDKGSYLYAAFGAPIAHEDDAVRACLAALDLRDPGFDFSTPCRSASARADADRRVRRGRPPHLRRRWATMSTWRRA